MKLEVGKKYRTRDGNHIVEILQKATSVCAYPYYGHLDGTLDCWSVEGRFSIVGGESDFDLVEEFLEKSEVNNFPELERNTALPELPVLNISRRDYFAGLALQELLASKNSNNIDHLTTTSVKLADNLIKKLDKEN